MWAALSVLSVLVLVLLLLASVIPPYCLPILNLWYITNSLKQVGRMLACFCILEWKQNFQQEFIIYQFHHFGGFFFNGSLCNSIMVQFSSSFTVNVTVSIECITQSVIVLSNVMQEIQRNKHFQYILLPINFLVFIEIIIRFPPTLIMLTFNLQKYATSTYILQETVEYPCG